MNARYWFLAVVLLCVLYVPQSCFSEPPGITVRGKVYKARSSVDPYPLIDVSVWLLSGEGIDHAVVGTGFTDSAGIYYIPNVHPGKYVLQFYLLKNLLQQYQIVVPSDPGSLNVSPNDPSIRFFDIAPLYLDTPARF